MRLDKFLKLSRIIKRRTVANDAAKSGKILINSKVAKPGDELKIGDVITTTFNDEHRSYEVLSLMESPNKDQAKLMYKELWFVRSEIMKKTKKGGITAFKLGLISLFLIVSIHFYNQVVTYNKLVKEDKAKQEEIAELKDEISDVKVLLSKSKTQEFIELIARDELGMIKPKEIKVVDKVDTDIFKENK